MEALIHSKLHGSHPLEPINQTGLRACACPCWPEKERNVRATPAGILTHLALPSNRGNTVLVENLSWVTFPYQEHVGERFRFVPRSGVLPGGVCGVWDLRSPLLFGGRIFRFRS